MPIIGKTAQRILEQRIKRRKLPSVDVPPVDNPALSTWMEGVAEQLRVFDGSVNNPKQRFVTIDELEQSGVIGTTVLSNFAAITEVLGDPVQKVKGTPYEFPNTGGSGGDGGGHVKFINDLLDVATTAPTLGGILHWGSTSKWTDSENLLWFETLDYLQFSETSSINWLDPDAVSSPFLRLAPVGEVIQDVHHVSFIDTTKRTSGVALTYNTLTTFALAGVLNPFDQYLFYAQTVYGCTSLATSDIVADNALKFHYGDAHVTSIGSSARPTANIVNGRGQKFAIAEIWQADAISDFYLSGRPCDAPSNLIESNYTSLYCLNLTQLGEANWEETAVFTGGFPGGVAENVWADAGDPLIVGDGISDYIVFMSCTVSCSDVIIGNSPDYEFYARLNGGGFVDEQIWRVGGDPERDGETYQLAGILLLEAPAADTEYQFSIAWNSLGNFTALSGSISMGVSAIVIRANAFAEHYMSASPVIDILGSGEHEVNTLSFTSTSATNEWGFLGGIASWFESSGFDGNLVVRTEINGGGDVTSAGNIDPENLGDFCDAELIAACPTGTEFTIALGDTVNVGAFWTAPPIATGPIAGSGVVAFNYFRSQPLFVVGDNAYGTQITGAAIYCTPPTYFADKIAVTGEAHFRDRVRVIEDVITDKSIYLLGIPAYANADQASYGRIWVSDDGNTAPRFVDDTGAVHAMTSGVLDGQYMFETSTTASTPAEGFLRFDNALPASVTNIYLDDLDALGNEFLWVLDNLSIGDQVVIRSEPNPGVYMICEVRAAIVVPGTSWKHIPVTVLYSGNTLPAAGELLRIGVTWSSHGTGGIPLNTYTKDLRIYDAGETDYLAGTHDGTDVNFNFTSTAAINFLNGIAFKIWDATNADNIAISHDGTDVNINFTSTTDINFLNGIVFKIWDATNADSIAISHDGTDAFFAFTNTFDVDFSGASQYNFDGTAQYSGTFRVINAGLTDQMDIQHDGIDVNVNFTNTGDINFLDGIVFKIWDATNTDSIAISHDGTDASIAFLNTTDVAFSGASGQYTFASTVSTTGNFFTDGATPRVRMYETDQVADEGMWDTRVSSGNWEVRTRTDADGAGQEALRLIRGTGTAVSAAQVYADRFDVYTNAGVLKLNFNHSTSNLWLRDGYTLKISDTGDTDYIELSHNGTSGLFTCTNSTQLIFTGAEVYSFDDGVVQGFAVRGSRVTSTELEDITDDINTNAGKRPGCMVFNTTTSKPVWAVGAADGSVWVDATGSTAHTPV